MNLFIGIDGGGSKTTCVLGDESLKRICEYQSGPSNFLSIGTEKVSKTILELIRRCCEDQSIDSSKIKKIVLGTTGAGRESDAVNLSNSIIESAKSNNITIN
jgi:N-acetylglucosamine kinase